MQIDRNINRLTLYHSRFEKEERTDTSLILTFEWAKLNNLKEFGIPEMVHLGETRLLLGGIKNEILKAYYSKINGVPNTTLEDAGEVWNEVENIETDEQRKNIHINGFYYKNGDLIWIEWYIEYDTCCIEWNQFVTDTELNCGLLPSNKPGRQ